MGVVGSETQFISYQAVEDESDIGLSDYRVFFIFEAIV